MNFLILLLGAVAVSALPRKIPNKFPKKYNPETHQLKDTYSIYKPQFPSPNSKSGQALPPIMLSPVEGSSYLSYTGAKEQPLTAPVPSSYVSVSPHVSGQEVMASLAAMVQALPLTSSYSHYQPEDAALPQSAQLQPPSPRNPSKSNISSYSEIGQSSPPSSAVQVMAAKKAGIKMPLPFLEVPPAPAASATTQQ